MFAPSLTRTKKQIEFAKQQLDKVKNNPPDWRPDEIQDFIQKQNALILQLEQDSKDYWNKIVQDNDNRHIRETNLFHRKNYNDRIELTIHNINQLKADLHKAREAEARQQAIEEAKPAEQREREAKEAKREALYKRRAAKGLVSNLRAFAEANPMEWLVKGRMPAVGVGLVYAPAKSAKSVLGLHWCAELTKAGGTALNIVGETPRNLDIRFKAWCQIHKEAYEDVDERVYFWTKGWRATEEGVTNLILTMQDEDCKLIIVDPLKDVFPLELDMSNTGHMMQVMNQFNRLAESLKCCVVIMHHTTKDEASAMGSYMHQCSAAFVAKLSKSGEKLSLHWEMMRDAEGGMTDTYHLEKVGGTVAVTGGNAPIVTTPPEEPESRAPFMPNPYEGLSFNDHIVAIMNNGRAVQTWNEIVIELKKRKAWNSKTASQHMKRAVKEGKVTQFENGSYQRVKGAK